jgi:hypothetical protein
MGRWSCTKFFGTQGKITTVITAYQVCDKPVMTATKKKSRTAAAQQASMVRQCGITNTRPRKQFCKDLMLFSQACKTQYEELLLADDFNETLDTNLSGMTSLASSRFC